jgi:hypothetical protein
MKVRKIQQKDINSFIDFNIISYPARNCVKESIYYRFTENPFNKSSEYEILIAEDEFNNIVGQVLLMPSKFCFKGEILKSFWAMDFIVNESNRGLIGFVLAKNAIKVENHFSLGLTKVALDLHLALGEKIVGYMCKYIKLNFSISLLRFLLKRNRGKAEVFSFPDYLSLNEGKFKRVYSPEEIVPHEGYWNSTLVEFIRDKEFMKWRFFYYPDKYGVYKYIPNIKNDILKPSYFVVRPIVWKRVNCLLLVDYRFSFSEKEIFNMILKSTSKLAKHFKMAATLTGCSLPSCYPILGRNMFFRYGEDLELVTKFQLIKEIKEQNSDSVFTTFADSDSDFYYGDDKW